MTSGLLKDTALYYVVYVWTMSLLGQGSQMFTYSPGDCTVTVVIAGSNQKSSNTPHCIYARVN